VSKRAAHHLHDLRVLEGPPGNLKGSVMVCCEAYPNLQVWQRLDFLINRRSLGRGLFHSLACPIPTGGQTIELDTSDIERQVGEFATSVPEETERA
jgi:hypothetical protein